MASILLMVIVIFSFFIIGLVLIVGSLRRWEPLFRPTGFHMRLFPYRLMKKLYGDKVFASFHIFIGIVFVLGSIWLLIHILFNF